LSRARYDRSITEQVKLEPPDRIRCHDVSGRAAEMKRVERALYDAGTAFYTLFLSRQEGKSPIMIDCEDISGTYLLAKASAFTLFRIELNTQ
jgi:hypothetical protein